MPESGFGALSVIRCVYGASWDNMASVKSGLQSYRRGAELRRKAQMLESITDYVIRIGGPIVVISASMFFVLRHYVTERIKSDFAKQLEDIRQQNQTAIEVLRGTTQKDLEALKSSLEVSRSATRILIERRIQLYEEYFRAYYALDDAINAMDVVFQTAEQPDREQRILEAQLTFYAAMNDFESWWTKGRAFIREEISLAVHELYEAAHAKADAIQQLDRKAREQHRVAALKLEARLERMIRDDLVAIQKSGTLPEA